MDTNTFTFKKPRMPQITRIESECVQSILHEVLREREASSHRFSIKSLLAKKGTRGRALAKSGSCRTNLALDRIYKIGKIPDSDPAAAGLSILSKVRFIRVTLVKDFL